MSRWQMAHRPLVCQVTRCQHVIAAGEWYRQMSTANFPYCAECAERETGDTKPETAEGTLYAARPAVDWAARMARFSRPQMAAAVRGNILDWRAKQAGDAE